MYCAFLFGFLVLAASFQFFFWSKVLGPYKRKSTLKHDVKSPSVSIVIAAWNEADHLKKYLLKILEQDYPFFDVIVVDDGSTDETLAILRQFENPKLRIVSKEHCGKKAALTAGIDLSEATWIVCTDADCWPTSKAWLRLLLKEHQVADVILGYGPYQGDTSWASRLLRYETWYIAIQYVSSVLVDRPYMGVGRNMAFRRAVFKEVGGYDAHKDIRSGDDDLFIVSLRGKYRFLTCLDDDAWMYSVSGMAWNNIWQQKRRHLSTATHYVWTTKLWLMAVFLSHLLIYVLPVVLVVAGYYWALGIILLRWLLLLCFGKSRMKVLGLRDLWVYLPLLDFVLVGYYLVHGLMMSRKKEGW